jgi:hypothetical protein
MSSTSRPSLATISGSAVVFVGNFNPAIFQPSWFARMGLISDEEANAASLYMIHPQLSAFETESFTLQATSNMAEFIAEGKPFRDIVRDVAEGTFGVLSHTPIFQMGINHWEDFEVLSAESWHKVGNELAPKGFWNRHVKHPGMQSLVIRAGREDDYEGHIDVTVEPSTRFGGLSR